MTQERPFNTAAAVEAMTTRLAQIGLAEGWGLDVWMYAGNGEPFKKSEVYREKFREANEVMETLKTPGKNYPAASFLLGIWQTKREREAELNAKYWRTA